MPVSNDFLEDAEELIRWARKSVIVASRVPAQSRKRKRSG
jgi:hypothetical protein